MQIVPTTPVRVVDLRSDTLTLPTPGMRQAMAQAEVGDDVFGEDPTVRRLEEHVADRLGHEAALFVVSGTMGNQLAIRAQTDPGDEILVEANAHIYYYEAGAPAALSGVMCRCLPGQRGLFTAQEVEAALRPADAHFPPTRLVCLENTHNRGGGSIWPLPQLADVAAVAKKHQLRLHLDGARLWNASVATGIPERQYAQYFDSVSVCFSKGLGSPVGSALVGKREFILRARRFRKQFGGGMRQAGILAAGALYALEHHRSRLAEDHEHAQLLGRGLAELPGIELAPIETNLVFFRVPGQSAKHLVQQLAAVGVRMLALGPDLIRAVTHLNVNREDMDRALAVCRRIIADRTSRI